MKDKLPWILLVVSVALNAFFVGGYVNAQVAADRVETVKGRAAAVAERLGLSAEQRQAFSDLRQGRREARQRLRSDSAAVAGAYWDEVVKDRPDAAVLADLQAQRLERRRLYQSEITGLMRDFVQGLTPEQRGRFAEFMKRRLERRRGHSWRRRHSPAVKPGHPFLGEGRHPLAEVLGDLA